MNIKAILAAGPAGILTAGGGILYAQHELHYLLRPSVVETIAGIAAVGGGIVWSRNASKRKQAKAEQAPEQESRMVVWEPQKPQQALPPTRPIDYTTQLQRERQREI